MLDLEVVQLEQDLASLVTCSVLVAAVPAVGR